MAEYNNNNNNGYQSNKVTTSGMTLFDENGIMLKMGYLDDSLSLVIGEPVTNDSGKRTYPQETRYPFILTMDRANALYEHTIMEKTMGALESHTNYNGGVLLNRRGDSMLEIRVQNDDIYMVYYTDINEDRVAGKTHVFKFNKTILIEGYNPTGVGDFERVEVQGYFAVFCKYLEAGIFDVHNSSVHSFRKGNYYTTSKIFDNLSAIGAKLGISFENRNNYHYNNASARNAFMEDTPNGEEEVPFVPEVKTNTLDGLIA